MNEQDNKKWQISKLLAFYCRIHCVYILQNGIDLNHSLTRSCFLKGRKINYGKGRLQMVKKNIITRAGGGRKKLRYHLNFVRQPEKKKISLYSVFVTFTNYN